MQIKCMRMNMGDTEGVQLQLSYHDGYQLNLVKECTLRSVHSTVQQYESTGLSRLHKKIQFPAFQCFFLGQFANVAKMAIIHRKTSENSRWTPQNLLPSLVGCADGYSLLKGKRIVCCVC